MFVIDKTKIAKFAAHLVVASGTYSVANNAIEDHTNMNPDGIPAKVACGLAGETVASTTDKYTDAIIDSAVNRYRSWKTNRNAEK